MVRAEPGAGHSLDSLEVTQIRLARLSRDFTDVKQCCSSHWIFVLTNIGIFQV